MIRILAAQTLGAFMQRNVCRGDLDPVHSEYLVDGILIHMDDANAAVQDAAAQCLVSIATTKNGVVPVEIIKGRLELARQTPP